MALTIAIEGKGVIANADASPDSAMAGSLWNEDGAGTDSFTTDTFYYGDTCFAGAYSNKAGYQYYDIGSANILDFDVAGNEEDQHIYMWIHCPTIGLLETKANKGLTVRIGSDLTTDYREFLIAGSDDANGWDGKWKCFVIDPTKAGSVTDTGTFDVGAIRYFGVWIETKAIARGDNIFISQIAVGKGLRITGDSTTSWKDIVDYCTDRPNRTWGMFQEREDVFYQYGTTYIGDATNQAATVSFTDADRTIQAGISEYWNGTAWVTLADIDYMGLAIEDHASYTTTFSDGVVVGSDNGRSGSALTGNANHKFSLDLYGGNNTGSVTTLYGTKFKALTGSLTSGNDADHKFFGVSWSKCAQFDPVGAPQIRNNIFAETIDVDAALLWNENINIQSSNFIANTLGAAIEMPSDTGTPYSYTALFFSGNTYDVLNSSGSAITVNKLSLSDPSTYEGSAVTFSATFSHKITGLELNTEVTYVTADTSTELYHIENATTSDGDGKYQIEYSHAGGAAVDILIHNVAYKPDISNIYGITLPNSDAIVKVAMFADDNYYNPA